MAVTSLNRVGPTTTSDSLIGSFLQDHCPTELVRHILLHLDLRSMREARLACKRFASILDGSTCRKALNCIAIVDHIARVAHDRSIVDNSKKVRVLADLAIFQAQIHDDKGLRDTVKQIHRIIARTRSLRNKREMLVTLGVAQDAIKDFEGQQASLAAFRALDVQQVGGLRPEFYPTWALFILQTHAYPAWTHDTAFSLAQARIVSEHTEGAAGEYTQSLAIARNMTELVRIKIACGHTSHVKQMLEERVGEVRGAIFSARVAPGYALPCLVDLAQMQATVGDSVKSAETFAHIHSLIANIPPIQTIQPSARSSLISVAIAQIKMGDLAAARLTIAPLEHTGMDLNRFLANIAMQEAKMGQLGEAQKHALGLEESLHKVQALLVIVQQLFQQAVPKI